MTIDKNDNDVLIYDNVLPFFPLIQFSSNYLLVNFSLNSSYSTTSSFKPSGKTFDAFDINTF
jgi:hypothetical protein